MAWLAVTNNAQTTLTGAVTLLASSITPLSKIVFPDPDTDGDFYVTISDPAYPNPTDDSTRETVLVTTNDTTAWTVTRAQCGTSAQEHSIGDRVSLYLMVEHIEAIEAAIDLNTGHRTSTGADHSYIDQAVTVAGTPQFGKLGLGAAAGTSRITLVAGTTAADGVDFGGDVTLYRSAANVLKTDDSLHIGGTALSLVGGSTTISATGGWVKLESNNRVYINYDNNAIPVQVGRSGYSLAMDVFGTIAPTGGIPLPENAAVILDSSLSADGKYTGITRAGVAGAALAFGDLIYLDPTDSRWELADANSAAAADGDARGVLGICVLAAEGNGSATKVLLWGNVRADTAFPALTINAPAYVSETAGDIVVTQPTTSGVVIRTVGFALTADELLFCPSADYITHT